MTILFSNCSLKIGKQDIFGPKFRHFYFFHDILQLDIFEGADFKQFNIVFIFPLKNTQIRHFWSQIKESSILHQTLQQGKIVEADFIYVNNIFKFWPKNTEIRDIFGPKCKDFYFCNKLCSQAHSRALTSNMTMVFQIVPQSTQLRHFGVQN